VRRNRFDDIGARAVNIGGSTGLEYFQPPLTHPPFYEAKDIHVEGNRFVGGDAPVAFVGVFGAVVRYNTIFRPAKWALRILQETAEEGFVPCGNNEFSRNIVVFRTEQWSEGGVNIGPHTAPETFKFSNNFWFCESNPFKSAPNLPVEETGGIYGQNPCFRDPEKGDLRLRSDSPARGVGMEALTP
jgi:hypothetical protein